MTLRMTLHPVLYDTFLTYEGHCTLWHCIGKVCVVTYDVLLSE